MTTQHIASPDQKLIDMLLSQPVSRAVEQSSDLLKRWYVLERWCMRAMAGWLPGVATQEIKLLLARHLWMDANAADSLRQRIMQLRYPRRDVERKWDQSLIDLMQSATNAPDELCFVAGIYRAIKPAMLEAQRRAIAQSEAVGDSPTRWLCEQLVIKTQRELDEMQPLLKDTESRGVEDASRRQQWSRYVDAIVAAIGGINGEAPRRERPSDASLEKPFARSLHAARDPRYTRRCELMCHHPIFWETDDPGFEWISHAVGHLNEMWAAEATAALVWDHPEAPWELLLDAARWCYDEARHTQMGITRLTRAGFDLFNDVPAPDTVTYDCYEPHHIRERMLSIHCFERGGVMEKMKQNAMKWHDRMGDQEGARHYDFDWADESIHLQYGLDWLKHLYGEQILDKDFDRQLNDAVEYRHEFLKQLAERERPLVERYFRDMCGKLGVPFKTRAVEHYKGRE